MPLDEAQYFRFKLMAWLFAWYVIGHTNYLQTIANMLHCHDTTDSVVCGNFSHFVSNALRAKQAQ